jgi:O-antigen/teichoic acid export membrane protein
MGAKIANIAKNTSYFTMALVLQKVISFSYFTIIARSLSPEDLGKYYFAISFTTIFSIFIDIGMANVLTREVARPDSSLLDDKEPIDTATRSSRLLGAVIAIKLPLAAFSFIALNFIMLPLGYSDLIKDLVYLSSACMILDSLTLTLFAVARGFHNLLWESIASFLYQLVVLLTGLAVIRYGLGLRWLMGALVAASTFNFAYSAILVNA